MTPLSPAVVALLYAGLASLWIVASSLLLSFSITDAELQGRIELAKGLAFVVVTSLLLYAALRTQNKRLALRQADSAETSPSASIYRALPVLALSVFTVPLLAFAVFTLNSAQEEEEALRDLQSIATLKAGQIEGWLGERVRDGAVLSTSTGFIERVQQIRQPGSARDEELVRDHLSAMIYHYQYESITLVDAAGKALLSVGRPYALPDDAPAWISKALASGQAQLGELSRDSFGVAYLDVYAPLMAGREPVGAVALSTNPERFLYPLIKAWPTASPTGEILLVRRDGDSVLYLNDLRHRSATALQLRQPLATADLPAAMAVRAARPGTLRGVDYRGASVLGAHLPVAGTTWHIVTKIDRVEAIAPAWYLAFWVGLVASFAYAIVVSVVLALVRERQRAHELAMQAQSDRVLRQFFDLPFVGMAITDPATRRWQWINDRLCNMLGYSREELTTKDWTDITHPDDLGRDLNELAKVTRGESDGYTLEKRFVRKDGSVLHVVLDLKCRRKPDRSVECFIVTIEDITERRNIELLNARLIGLYRALSAIGSAIVRSTSENELFALLCRVIVEQGGTKMAWIGMVNRNDRSVQPVASYGTGTEYLLDLDISVDADDPRGHGPTGTAIRENRPYWCQDFHNDPATRPWHERAARYGWAACAALPIRHEDVTVGAITLYTGETHAFDDKTQALLVEIARNASAALDMLEREHRRRKAEQETMQQLDALRGASTPPRSSGAD